MMQQQLTTFYWDPSPRRRWRSRRKRQPKTWNIGNAGDLFNLDLINWAYANVRTINAGEGISPKLLLVGSIARLVGSGDVVNGIGAKGDHLASAPAGVLIRGLRGPLSFDAFERAGYDTAEVSFLGDPGLVIGRVFPELSSIRPEPGRTVVIPHYRQRNDFWGAPIPVVQIDARALDVGREIARSEHVYTSSLHGLIWAHALGRPATLIVPPNEEPIFKYEDYLLSVGRSLGSIQTLDEALRSRKPDSPVDVSGVASSITMPALADLQAMGIVN